MNDTELWSLLINGDQVVLEVLYRRHYPLLLNYGLKCCLDKELVKDCIQDVFVKLHNSKGLSATNSPRSYLLKSVRNAIYDKLSSTKEMDELSECEFYISDSQDGFEQLFSKSDEELQLNGQVLNALSLLSSNQKAALYFRYIKELSYKEIAEVMDMNLQSSMNLVSRALTKMRQLLDFH